MSNSHPLSSRSYLHDLLSVVLYTLAIAVIAAAVYAGIWAVAPVAGAGVLSVVETLDRVPQPASEPRQPSNFEQWLADRGASRHPKPAAAKAMEDIPAPRVLPGPGGIAATAKAKALAELGGARAQAELSGARPGSSMKKKKGVRDDAVLPSAAKPVEQTGYSPPPAIDLHRVY